MNRIVYEISETENSVLLKRLVRSGEIVQVIRRYDSKKEAFRDALYLVQRSHAPVKPCISCKWKNGEWSKIK